MTIGAGHHHPEGKTDSAGQPWAGRSFGATPFAGDDGSAPPEFLTAITAFRAGEAAQAKVIDTLRDCRLLIPLVASLGEAGTNEAGVTVDKSADLAIVTVAGPDGRNVLPVFSSVAAMQAWNPKARPVPADAVRVALAAADESTDLVVVDATAETEFVIRRPALWAMAQSAAWMSPLDDRAVGEAFAASVEPEVSVVQVRLRSGDPEARLRGPEVIVELALRPGLDQAALQSLLGRLQERWATNDAIASKVDSMAVRLVPASE